MISDDAIFIQMTDTGALGATALGPTGTDGPAVVFTHGWLHDHHVWDGTVAALSPHVRCVTWDLRAHGESAAAARDAYTREHVLGDLREVIATVGSPVVLAGHSLGGYLSLAHTILHPEDVTALVLIAAGPGFRNPESREQWNETVRKTAAAESGLAEGSEAMSEHVDSWVIDNLEAIKVPTLVIVGEYDKRFQASAALFEKSMDVRKSLVIAESGHNVHLKKGPEIAAAIADFLSDVSAS